MSDLAGQEIELDGGFLEEAGISGNDIPDDPFGFGREFWPLRVIEVGPPKVTANADKVGFMVKFAIDHPQFQGTPLAEGLGNGNWYRLPVPKALQGQIPWDASSSEAAEVKFNLGELYKALGFKRDEYSGVNGEKMLHRGCLAKVSAKKNEAGFWNFNLWQMKPMDGSGAPTGANVTARSASNGGMTDEEMLKRELEDS